MIKEAAIKDWEETVRNNFWTATDIGRKRFRDRSPLD